MTRATATTRISVTAPPSGDLPPSGSAKLVAAAESYQSVKPAAMSAGQWRYTIFGSYGSGMYNPHYTLNGPHGAFMLAASGGHSHPSFFGGVGFDWNTRAWFYKPAVGVADRGASIDLAETNGPPWYEMLGTEVPAVPHPYRNQAVIPPSLGGSAVGDLIYIVRHALLNGGQDSSRRAHRFNPLTGVWSRASAGSSECAYSAVEATTIFDPVTGRFYLIRSQQYNHNFLAYLDSADWTYKTVSTTNRPAAIGGYASHVLWGRYILMMHDGTLQTVNLDNLSAGWSTLSVSAPLPTGTQSWAYHEAQGVLYHRDQDGGQILRKLTPPANPLTGTWVLSSQTLGGDAVPNYTAAQVGTSSQRSLHYIPSLQMLGWVSANGCALLNP